MHLIYSIMNDTPLLQIFDYSPALDYTAHTMIGVEFAKEMDKVAVLAMTTTNVQLTAAMLQLELVYLLLLFALLLIIATLQAVILAPDHALAQLLTVTMEVYAQLIHVYLPADVLTYQSIAMIKTHVQLTLVTLPLDVNTLQYLVIIVLQE